MNNTQTENLQNLYTSINSTLKYLDNVDESIFNSVVKEQLEFDLTKVLKGLIKYAQQKGSTKLEDLSGFNSEAEKKVKNTKIKIVPGCSYLTEKYYPCSVYKDGELIGIIAANELTEIVRLYATNKETLVCKKNKVIKYGINLPADDSVQSRFFRLVVDTVAENCDEETLGKIAEVFKDHAIFPVDETNIHLLTKVWELCVRILFIYLESC